MSSTLLRKLPKYSNNFRTVAKTFYRSIETIQPVKLAFVTYESSTVSPVIVVHGLFGSKSNWNTVCKYYQQKTDPKRRIVAVDLRNHGRSTHSDEHSYEHLVVDLLALIEELGVKKVVFVGHSMGGRTVMLLALKYPHLIEKLIVVDISPLSSNKSLLELKGILQAIAAVTLPKEGPISKANAMVDAQLEKTISNKALRLFLLTNLLQNEDGSYRWKMNVPSLLKNFERIEKYDVPVEGGNLKYEGPMLLLAGTESDFVPETDLPGILALFPNADIQYVDGAGHWLHSDRQQEFLRLTLQFLNKK